MATDRKCSLLIHPKDSPFTVHSGYSVWGNYISRGLKDAGWPLAVYAPVGVKYNVLTFDDIDCYPGTSEDFGENLVDMHLNRLKKDTGKEPVMVQIADVWALSRTPNLARQGKIRWIIAPAVDWIQPTPKYVLDKLGCALAVVPWCRYGQDMLRREGLKNVKDFIPLGVNTDLFRPLDRGKFPETMKSLGFEEGAFNIAIIAANQFLRKPFYEWFVGIRMFMDANPAVKVRLYVHCPTVVKGGYNLSDLAKHIGIDKITKTSDDYAHICGDYDEKTVVKILAMADCLLMGGLEGFGMPTIEAQACGTPVIGLNVGATAELIKSGILVPPKGTFCVPNLLVKALPHEKGIADALQTIHESPRSRWKSGIRFVRENFSWPIIIDKWVKLIEDVETELDGRCELEIPKPSEALVERAKEIKVVE